MLPRVPDKIPAMSPHFFKLEWPLPKSAPVSAPPRTELNDHSCTGTERSTFRLARTPDGEPSLNYLCPSYKAFFHHVNRPMRAMSGMHRARRAPAGVMKLYAAHDATRAPAAPCTCGGGKPWGDCHGVPPAGAVEKEPVPSSHAAPADETTTRPS